MSILKKMAAVFIAGMICLSCTSVSFAATEYTSGDYKYTVLYDGTAKITQYVGASAEVTVPSVIGSHTVTAIGDGAFSNKTRMRSVTIPDSVTEIGTGLFYNCSSLKTLTVGDGVESIEYLFEEPLNSLETVNLGKSVIGVPIFNIYCPSLKCINVSEENEVLSSEDGVLYDKAKTRIFAYPSQKEGDTFRLPNSVIVIFIAAFAGCENLEHITLPEGLFQIGNYAFLGCTELKSINIPVSVKYINGMAFLNCTSLSYVVIPYTVMGVDEAAFGYETDDDGEFYPVDGFTVYAADGTAGAEYAWSNSDFNSVIYTPGDLNDDGDVNSADYAMIRSYVMASSPLIFEQLIFADCDYDTSVDAFDAIIIDIIAHGD